MLYKLSENFLGQVYDKNEGDVAILLAGVAIWEDGSFVLCSRKVPAALSETSCSPFEHRLFNGKIQLVKML